MRRPPLLEVTEVRLPQMRVEHRLDEVCHPSPRPARLQASAQRVEVVVDLAT